MRFKTIKPIRATFRKSPIALLYDFNMGNSDLARRKEPGFPQIAIIGAIKKAISEIVFVHFPDEVENSTPKLQNAIYGGADKLDISDISHDPI